MFAVARQAKQITEKRDPVLALFLLLLLVCHVSSNRLQRRKKDPHTHRDTIAQHTMATTMGFRVSVFCSVLTHSVSRSHSSSVSSSAVAAAAGQRRLPSPV